MSRVFKVFVETVVRQFVVSLTSKLNLTFPRDIRLNDMDDKVDRFYKKELIRECHTNIQKSHSRYRKMTVCMKIVYHIKNHHLSDQTCI